MKIKKEKTFTVHTSWRSIHRSQGLLGPPVIDWVSGEISTIRVDEGEPKAVPGNQIFSFIFSLGSLSAGH